MTLCICGAALERRGGAGRPPRFCSGACRQRAYRRRAGLPSELTGRASWTRREGKRPITVSGRSASTTKPRTWASFDAVKASKAGDGFGLMLGDGLACWDLDHCLDGSTVAPWARAVLDSIESPVWVERSLSGDGLHVFVLAGEEPGTRRDGVEFYSWARFIAVTGDRFDLTV